MSYERSFQRVDLDAFKICSMPLNSYILKNRDGVEKSL